MSQSTACQVSSIPLTSMDGIVSGGPTRPKKSKPLPPPVSSSVSSPLVVSRLVALEQAIQQIPLVRQQMDDLSIQEVQCVNDVRQMISAEVHDILSRDLAQQKGRFTADATQAFERALATQTRNAAGLLLQLKQQFQLETEKINDKIHALELHMSNNFDELQRTIMAAVDAKLETVKIQEAPILKPLTEEEEVKIFELVIGEEEEEEYIPAPVSVERKKKRPLVGKRYDAFVNAKLLTFDAVERPSRRQRK